jgi:hypothetical protein
MAEEGEMAGRLRMGQKEWLRGKEMEQVKGGELTIKARQRS